MGFEMESEAVTSSHNIHMSAMFQIQYHGLVLIYIVGDSGEQGEQRPIPFRQLRDGNDSESSPDASK